MANVTVTYAVARIIADCIPKGTVMNDDALNAAAEFLEAVVAAEPDSGPSESSEAA